MFGLNEGTDLNWFYCERKNVFALQRGLAIAARKFARAFTRSRVVVPDASPAIRNYRLETFR